MPNWYRGSGSIDQRQDNEYRMTKIRDEIIKLKIKYPLWVLLAFLVCYRVISAFMKRHWNGLLYRIGLQGKLHPYLSGSCFLMVMLLTILILMCLANQIDIFSRERKRLPGALIPGLYMIVISLLIIVIGLIGTEGFQSRGTIIFSSLYFILVAVTEELVYRGVAADIFLKTFMFRSCPGLRGICGQEGRRAVWTATFCSGLLFGLVHISNMSSANISGVLVQMLGAFLMGMVLVAVYYRTANIYAVIIMHAVNDIAAAMPVTILKSEQNVSDVISGYGIMQIVSLIPYLIVLLVIIRPSKIEEIWRLWTYGQVQQTGQSQIK